MQLCNLNCVGDLADTTELPCAVINLFLKCGPSAYF